MRLLLTRSESIELTTTITLLTLYHLCLLLLVRLGGYIVTLSDFYSYRLIGKLTAFLQLQEFSLRNQTVDSSTSAARLSLPSSKAKTCCTLASGIERLASADADAVTVEHVTKASHTHAHTCYVSEFVVTHASIACLLHLGQYKHNVVGSSW